MPHSKFLSQVFQVGFWCHKKRIWSTHLVDWEVDLKSLYLLNTRVVHVGPLVFAVSAIPCLFNMWPEHLISMIVKSDVGSNRKKRLHIPQSKFSTIQLHKIVLPLFLTAYLESTKMNTKVSCNSLQWFFPDKKIQKTKLFRMLLNLYKNKVIRITPSPPLISAKVTKNQMNWPHHT